MVARKMHATPESDDKDRPAINADPQPAAHMQGIAMAIAPVAGHIQMLAAESSIKATQKDRAEQGLLVEDDGGTTREPRQHPRASLGVPN